MWPMLLVNFSSLFSFCVTARRVILTLGIHFTTDGRDLQNLDLHFTSTWESQLWVKHSPKAIDLTRILPQVPHMLYQLQMGVQQYCYRLSHYPHITGTKEQPTWQTQSILGTACKIPTLDAISRWARTHRSAEDGKSTANNLHAWKLSS